MSSTIAQLRHPKQTFSAFFIWNISCKLVIRLCMLVSNVMYYINCMSLCKLLYINMSVNSIMFVNNKNRLYIKSIIMYIISVGVVGAMYMYIILWYSILINVAKICGFSPKMVTYMYIMLYYLLFYIYFLYWRPPSAILNLFINKKLCFYHLYKSTRQDRNIDKLNVLLLPFGGLKKPR